MPAGDNPWKGRLALLVSTHVVGTLNIVSVMAMAPVITRGLDLGATEFGFLISAYYGAQALWSMPADGLTDRFGVARVIIACHAVMAAAALLISLALTYEAALVAMFMMGIGYAMTNPATSRAVLEWFAKERRGTAMGIKQVGVPVGGVLAAGNGALAAFVHWQTLMVAVAFTAAVNGVLCFYLLRFEAGTRERRGMWQNLREIARDLNVGLYTVFNGGLNFGQTNFFAFLALFLRDAVGASQPVAGFAVGLAQASSAVARILWGVVSDTLFGGRRKPLLVLICMAAGLLFIVVAAVGPAWGVAATLMMAVLLGATIASFAPVAQAISVEMVEPRLAGSAMGFNMVGVHIGGMIGPPVFGAIVDLGGGYSGGWMVTAAVTLAATVGLAVWFREGYSTD